MAGISLVRISLDNCSKTYFNSFTCLNVRGIVITMLPFYVGDVHYGMYDATHNSGTKLVNILA